MKDSEPLPISALRNDIRSHLATVADGMRRAPTERWWAVTYRNLSCIEKAALSYPDDVRIHIQEQLIL